MGRVSVLIALCCSSLAWAFQNKPVEATNKVEPDWSNLPSGYLIERLQVNMDVTPQGEPFALLAKSGGSIPDNVVRALAQWRFKPTPGFRTVLTVPIRVRLTPAIERSQRPLWQPPTPLFNATKAAADLDADKALQLLANLPQGEEPDNVRATLLTYYATKGATDIETARKVRRDLIAWLVRTYPQDAILASSYGVVNASGEPLADPDGSDLIGKAWLDALKQNPSDTAVVLGAANFLRLSQPNAALQLVADQHSWEQRSSWLGYILGSGGLGVNAVAPSNGAAVGTSAPQLAAEGLAASFRKTLLESSDLKILLSGVETTTRMARDLNARHALPSGYPDYCEALLKHTRELYPETSFTCDLPPIATKPPASAIQRIGGNHMEASLIKKVQPRYPPAAKDRRIQGTVEFTATIGPDGVVQNLSLVRGPLALYESSYDAVMQWRYRPTMLNGNAITVMTDIIVNYTLQ